MTQWAGPIFTWPLDAAQFERYLQATLETPPARLVWRAASASSAEYVGHVELNNIERHHRVASLCRVLIGPPFRGRGFSEAMLSAVLEIAFGELNLHRVELRVFTENESAWRAYERLGFVREGVLREVRLMNRRYVDAFAMALLEDEWRKKRASLR
jgi:RimJ/RimL family protein N-acetyltransferase